MGNNTAQNLLLPKSCFFSHKWITPKVSKIKLFIQRHEQEQIKTITNFAYMKLTPGGVLPIDYVNEPEIEEDPAKPEDFNS